MDVDIKRGSLQERIFGGCTNKKWEALPHNKSMHYPQTHKKYFSFFPLHTCDCLKSISKLIVLGLESGGFLRKVGGGSCSESPLLFLLLFHPVGGELAYQPAAMLSSLLAESSHIDVKS